MNPAENEKCYYCSTDLSAVKKQNWLLENSPEFKKADKKYTALGFSNFLHWIFFVVFYLLTRWSIKFDWSAIAIGAATILVLLFIRNITCFVIRWRLEKHIRIIVEKELERYKLD